MTTLYIVLAVLAVLVIWAIFSYNRFVTLVMRAQEAWADIDVQLKRRYDLIPNLINTVKGYAAHERETLDQVTQARTQATQIHIDPADITPEQIAAMSGAEAGLSQALGRLLAVAENYPDLKANENFLDLQRELTDTENKIQAARRFYNNTVMSLNTSLQSFPQNIIGNTFNFTEREFFELEDVAAREPVEVKF